MRKADESRIWVQRMLAGDWRVEDMSRLLRSLRGKTFGLANVKDIADLTAHEDDRDSGIMFSAVEDLYYSTRFHVEHLERPINLLALPGHFKRAVEASFRALPDARVREFTGLNRSVAQRTLDAAVRNLARNPDGTLNAKACSQEQVTLIRRIAGSFTVRPAYDDATVHRDVSAALIKNRFLFPAELRDFGAARKHLAIYLLSLLHRLDMRMPDGNVAELTCSMSGETDGRRLAINASWPIPTKAGVRIATEIFRTGLDAREWCSPELMQLAIPANDIPENPASWQIPVEVGPDWKLRPM